MSKLVRNNYGPSFIREAIKDVRDNSTLRGDLFASLENQFDDFFNGFFSNETFKSFKLTSGYPKLDSWIDEDNKELYVRFAIPGVSKENVKVEITPANRYGNKKILKVSGSMSNEYKNVDKYDYIVKELHKSKFVRELTIPSYVEGDPKAELKDGLLTLSWKIKPVDEEEVQKSEEETQVIPIG